MALKLYNVTINGYETVLQLDERDAKTRGLGSADLYKPEAAASTPDSADAAAAEAAEKAAADAAAAKAAPAPANKSRAAAANK